MFNASQLNRAPLNGLSYSLRSVLGQANAVSVAVASGAAANVDRAGRGASASAGVMSATAGREAGGRALALSTAQTTAEQAVFRGGAVSAFGRATILAFAPNNIDLTATFRAYAFSLAVAKGKLGFASYSSIALMSAIADRVKFSSATAVVNGLMTTTDGSVINYATADLVATAVGIGTGRIKLSGGSGFINTGVVEFKTASISSAAAGKQTLVSRPMLATSAMSGRANKVLPGFGEIAVGVAEFSAYGENITLGFADAVCTATAESQRFALKTISGAFTSVSGFAATPTQLQHGFVNAVGVATSNPHPGITRGVSAAMVATAVLTTPYLPLIRGGFANNVCKAFASGDGEPIVPGAGSATAVSSMSADTTRDRNPSFSANAVGLSMVAAKWTPWWNMKADAVASAFVDSNGERWRTVEAQALGEALGSAQPSRIISILVEFAALSVIDADGITNPATKAPSTRVFNIPVDNRQMLVAYSPRLMQVI